MNQGIILAFTAMLANSGYDLTMQQNSQRVKGDKNKFLFILAVVSVLLSFLVCIIKGLDLFRSINIFYGLFCGIIAFGGYYAYLLSMYGENRTVYTIIVRLSFVLSIMFSFLFFQDEVSIVKIIAIVLCCAAMLVLSLSEKNNPRPLQDKSSANRIFKDKFFVIAIVSCLFLSTLNVVNKYAAINEVDTFVVFFWRYITFSVILLFILAYKRYKRIKSGETPPLLATPHKAKFFLYAALGGLMIFISVCSMMEAMKQGDISVILPISQLSFVSTMFLNKLIYKEKMTKFKYAGAAIAFLSIMLVSFK
jgi:drug/metabolite transporter (DMT)-like permease